MTSELAPPARGAADSTPPRVGGAHSLISDGSHRSAPVDQPVMAGGGEALLIPAIMQGGALISRVDWSDAGDFDLVVTPLRFHAVAHRAGRAFVSPVHVAGDTDV